jgi:hypothetical protein
MAFIEGVSTCAPHWFTKTFVERGKQSEPPV